jgi:hypothetical protein
MFARRRFWLWLFAMSSVASALFAQLGVEPAQLNLGRHKQEKIVEGRVTLVNVGKQPLTINDVRADCSCTAALPEKTALAPGECTQMTIRIETRSYQGPLRRRVIVQTSQGDAIIPVELTVSPYENWTLEPHLLTLPPSPAGRALTDEVKLTHRGENSVEITGFTAEPAYVDGALAKRTGQIFTLALTKKAEAPMGNHLVKVIAHTTDPGEPKVVFSVFVPVVSEVTVSPNPLLLPVGKVGRELHFVGTLSGWSDGLPAPRYQLEGGEVEVLARAGESHRFALKLIPAEVGVRTRVLRVYADQRLLLEAPVIVRAE